MSPQSDRELDVVVYGATGFVGKLTALYLAGAAPDAKIALAGRSQEKLERVRSELPAAASEWPLIVADSSDRDAVGAMAASTRAVATTVGPYYKYGFPLVDACAAHGTHYADLTGETLFMRKSIDDYDEKAKASGARIVHTCGFDSIPSDIGTLLLHLHASENDLGTLGKTTLVVRATRGGVSGGTIDSLRGQLDAAKADKSLRKVMLDPYSLSPDRSAEPDLGNERDSLSISNEPELGGWLAPFVMGTVNSRVVRRSNALSEYGYGREMRYRETMLTGGLPLGPVKAASISGGLAALFAGLSIGPTRKLLDRVLPDPGEGPSEKTREKGFFKIDVHTTTSKGVKLVTKIDAPGDPGYKATAVMLGEAALALALDQDELPDAAGVLTPATAIGKKLADRLNAAGHSYSVSSA
jgi:short subunit dehydrogenase-like uncharacterized protein